ncbi:hypothetical protein [Mangrovimonas sp. ST2L15]|uniref:hypothetical protein n=1 Tax=Mangrovimonas sp. ST2L15 TaxID=1645916 RepID=UPI0006B4D0D0|nr:hypothetical protein [Mangrovimonas sp. ST2L15]
MNKIVPALMLLMITSITFGQKEVNASWKNYINPIFQGLDKAKVPHAILLDYAMEFANVQAYNGTLTDSTYVDMASLSNIYKTLYMGKVTNDTIYFPNIHHVAYNWITERIDQNTTSKNTLVITGLLYEYSIISPNALAQNKIIVNNNKYYDKYIHGTWQNPYLSQLAIAFSLPVTKYNKRDINLVLPLNLMLSNMALDIQKIELNPNDGLGYRQINYNQNYAISYASNGTYDVVFKVTLTNNQILYSHTQIEINQKFTSVKWEDRYGNP